MPPPPPGLHRRLGLLAACAFVAAGFAWLVAGVQVRPPAAVGPAFARNPSLDDSGTTRALGFAGRVTDPWSLEQVRDCLSHPGRRGIEQLTRDLAATPGGQQRLAQLMVLAQLHLYEGDPRAARTALAEARALADADEAAGRRWRGDIIFLQGVAALRQGETENCVECQCRSSCIFPLAREAVHQNPEGARAAVGHFGELLERWPDDAGGRWLFNLAHMTLGQYPEGVPAQHLLSPTLFASHYAPGRFVDVAQTAGVNRFDQGGAAICDDFDGDGRPDLVASSRDPAEPLAFYRNRGDGTFEDVTEAAGLAGQLGGTHLAQADYDNDGRLDLYVCRGGGTGVAMRHSLLRNLGGGKFEDVTRAAGLVTPVPSLSAAWGDYDNDGRVDLFVCGERGRSLLYRNRGDGTFEEVAERAGVACPSVVLRGACWGDYDNDGRPDLLLADQAGPPRLYRNRGDGTFTDIAPALGLTRPVGGVICGFWDYDNDGRLDVFVAGLNVVLSDVVKSWLGQPHGERTCRLYRNAGDRFEDVTAAAGLEIAPAALSAAFADLDNDGYTDLYLGTGGSGYSMLLPNRFFRNVGGTRFEDVTTASGTGHLQKCHGVASGDYDGDGDVDLYLPLGGETPGDRFRNVLFQNPGGGRSLAVRLVGRKANRSALGVRFAVTLPDGKVLVRVVTPGASSGGGSLTQTVGLGAHERAAAVHVLWPGSTEPQVVHDLAAGRTVTIVEPE